jgi:hypothetical protein
MAAPVSSSVALPTKATLFISYSRRDTAFVGALVAALEARGYEVLIDRSAVTKGEEWWKRIVDLIVASTLVLYHRLKRSTPVAGVRFPGRRVRDSLLVDSRRAR